MRWLPSLCAVCRGWGREPLCADCRARHARALPRCRRCAIGVAPGVVTCGACIATPPPFERAIAAVDYMFPWSGLVSHFKFQSASALAAPMAALIAERVAAEPCAPTLLLPVPLGTERLRERGMNQAWELARRIGRRLRVEAAPRLLERRFETPHLADLPREERAKAIRGAFAPAPGAPAQLQGRAVALIDDVLTSGATAAEAARVLLAAGAASVEVWVFARTPAPV